MLRLVTAFVLVVSLAGCLSYDPQRANERAQPLAPGAGIIGLQLTDQFGRPTNYTGACQLRFRLSHLDPYRPAFVRGSSEGGPLLGIVSLDAVGYRIPFDGNGGAVIVFTADDWMYAKSLPPVLELIAFGRKASGSFVQVRTIRLERKNERFLRAAIRLPRECYGYP